MIRLMRVVFGAELRSHLRDRRALASALIFPLIAPVLIGVMFTLLATWQSADRPLRIAVVGRERAPSLMAFLERGGAQLTVAPEDYEQKIRDDVLPLVLVIPSDYGDDFSRGKTAQVQVLQDGSNNKARSTVERAERLLRAYGSEIGALRLLARGVSPSLAAAVSVDDVDLATKQQQAAMLLNMIPVFLLMVAFTGGMHLAIDAMAGERERGSLEPLMVNPVSPLVLVVGKWLATVLTAAVAVAVMLAGLKVALGHIPLEDLGMKIVFGPHEVLRLLAGVAPLLLFTSALQVLVATFARSFKEAQTYVTLVMFVPIFPEIMLSFSPMKPQAWMSFVPTLGQQILMTSVMRGDPVGALTWVGATLGTSLAAALCLALTAKLLVKERIIFGR